MRIFNLVDENERAWHAGVSSWAGRSNLNDTAIGIETVNLACDNNGVFVFPPYNPFRLMQSRSWPPIFCNDILILRL